MWRIGAGKKEERGREIVNGGQRGGGGYMKELLPISDVRGRWWVYLLTRDSDLFDGTESHGLQRESLLVSTLHHHPL